MKKVLLSFAAAALLAFGAQEAKAQTPYKSAIGIVFDGNDGSNVGIQYKTAVGPTTAFQAQAAFRSNWVSLGADYQYEKAIAGAEGLAWYAGGGAHIGILTLDNYDGDKVFVGLRPQVGLEYRIPTVPLAFHLDYKPTIGIVNGSGFAGDGFTFGVKFELK
jgi:hypothetical protein